MSELEKIINIQNLDNLINNLLQSENTLVNYIFYSLSN